MTITTLETPDGEGELAVSEADDQAAVLLLGHGAGGDIDGWDLDLLAHRLPALGVTVARFRQPYRVAGRRIFNSKPGLDRAWSVALAEVGRRWPSLPLFTGGHSAGARTACRGFGHGQQGLVLLSFPLHPPGKPDQAKAEDVGAAAGPVLIVQGGTDGFGTPGEVRTALASVGRDDVRVVELPGAGHSMVATAGTTADQMAERERLMIWSVAAFIEQVLAGSAPDGPCGASATATPG
ncbi:MAG TPA: hydrolase [Propionibacteriaceae bacterium]|nr:hydrolase [Propionibacteriaceae bacterium]